jgi:hypothetical protein
MATLRTDPFNFTVSWSAVFAGALVAAAIAAVLHTFAAGVGLAVSSAAPTWRDGSAVLWWLSGLYLVFAALVSYGAGGYVAGRMRDKLADGTVDEREYRDGLHGALTWAVATLLTALLALAIVISAGQAASPSGNTGAATSVASENLIAYDIDRLFRSERIATQADAGLARAEAGRILLTASSHRGVIAEDRAHLLRLVSARTGLAGADAEKRVDQAITNAADNIGRARKSSVLIAFLVGSAAILGLAVAWFAAAGGGRQRDEDTAATFWLVR